MQEVDKVEVCEMADIPEVMSSDPTELLGVGRRHIAVRDYSSAVSCLGKACELLAEKYGQQADECGEAYLWYGKSLLGLAREESGVLGDGIPQGGEGEDNQEEDEGEDGADDDNEDVEMNGDDETKTTEEVDKSKPNSENDDNPKESKESNGENQEPGSSTNAASSTSSADNEIPGGSGESSKNNGEENVDEDEDEVENLQVAWEVLELARDIFVKRGESAKKELADVFFHLGEVSLESETYDKAVIDMGKSLEILRELYSPDDRRIAETHYQIGLAHSLSNGFDDAISNFKTAAEILTARIKTLESPTVANDDATVKKYLASDPFYSVDGEIKELKELLPEIQEKIQDMNDYKAEAIKSVRESLGIPVNGESSSKTNGVSKEPEQEKKASDISHLVKRKRKPSEETPAQDSSAPKKLAQ